MKDVMIDFETFGNGKNACVVQIGGCFFDRYSGELGKRFKMNVDARTSVEAGGEIDADTVYWWMSQSPEAIASVTEGTLAPFPEAFRMFNDFLSDASQIWSHATFDFVILSESLKLLKIKPRYSYRAARDIRTLIDLAGIDPKNFQREGVHHDALGDCFFQIKYCVEAFNALRLKSKEDV